MFIFDVLYEYTQKVVPALSVGIAAAGSTYVISNRAIDLIPSSVKEGLHLFGSGIAGLVAAIAIAETAPLAAVAFVVTSAATYGALAVGGVKIQTSVTVVASIGMGAVATSLMSGKGLFFNNFSSLPLEPYGAASSSSIPTTQHVGL